MANKKAAYAVEMIGTGVQVNFDVVEHELVGLPATTYHKFTFPNGSVMFYNDFGVKSVTIKPL